MSDNNMSNNKRIARNLLEIIGGTPKVIEYNDNNKTSKINLFISANQPDEGLSSYSTIGLSEYSIDMRDKRDKELRVEFIGVCESAAIEFPNIIATCAFNIINDNYSCKPGIVYPNIVKQYYKNLEMEHIYFTIPFLWDNLDDLEFDNFVVSWLLALPISNKEFDFLKANGRDALEDLFQENDIDIFNISRKSVL